MPMPIPALVAMWRRAVLPGVALPGAVVLAALAAATLPGAAQEQAETRNGSVQTGAGALALPDVSGLDRPQAEALIRQLAEVNVITSNCPDWAISDSEWTLITATGDRLAAMLGLDPGAYDRKYYGPAFALLDDPGACDRIGPQARPLIGRLETMGAGKAGGGAEK